MRNNVSGLALGLGRELFGALTSAGLRVCLRRVADGSDADWAEGNDRNYDRTFSLFDRLRGGDAKERQYSNREVFSRA